VTAMHCSLGVDEDPWNAARRLVRFSRVAARLSRLPRLEPRALRTIIAGMMKDLATVGAHLGELGIGLEEWRPVVERCGRLLNEVGRAVATVEALMAAEAPGRHEEALRRLAEILGGDECMGRLRAVLENRVNGATS